MRRTPNGMKWVGGVVAMAAMGAASCGQQPGEDEAIATKQGAVVPSANGPGQAPEIPPATIPRFQTQLPRFFTYAPTLTRNAQGQVTRKDFTVRIAKFTDQQLPPGFPSTPLFGYGGDVFVRYDANGQADPGARADRAGGVPAHLARAEVRADAQLVPDVTHYRNELAGAHLGPVDPTLDWANPNNFPKPSPPFAPFPPGYPQAQSPITHTTHTHGLEVLPGVRRHARHLVHARRRHPRARVRVERLPATKQQPVGAVLVSRPRVRRHPSGRRVRAVRVRDLARSGRRAARSRGQ